jgi:predicted small secreted protein
VTLSLRELALPILPLLALALLLSSCAARSGAGRDFIPTAVTETGQQDPAPEEILNRYFEYKHQTKPLTDYSVDVNIEAKLPSMHREGGMTATRVLKGGKDVSYRGAQFTGDNSIKGDVITRYLNGDRDSVRNPVNASITPENYRFEHRGVAMYLDRKVHVFEVIPREKRVGLYRGELWIDMETAQPLREFGRFVRSPSVFLKDVDFVRDYHLIGTRTLPVRFITKMGTRLVGAAEVVVHFSNYKIETAE